MILRAEPSVYDLHSWEGLEDHLKRPRAMTIVVGRNGPVVSMAVSGRSGDLRVTDPRHCLQAQERRRLHRLGLRPEPDTAERDWTWRATPPQRPTDAQVGDALGGRLGAWQEITDGCSRQVVAVLREGLGLALAQLTLLPVEEKAPDDDAWGPAGIVRD